MLVIVVLSFHYNHYKELNYMDWIYFLRIQRITNWGDGNPNAEGKISYRMPTFDFRWKFGTFCCIQ